MKRMTRNSIFAAGGLLAAAALTASLRAQPAPDEPPPGPPPAPQCSQCGAGNMEDGVECERPRRMHAFATEGDQHRRRARHAFGAQGGPGDGPRQGGQGRRGQHRFDPEKMQEFAMIRIKDQLDATDEQWADIQVPLRDVLGALRNRIGTHAGAMRGRHRGPQGTDGEQAAPPLPEGEALKALLENDEAADKQIEEKVTAFRKAQKELDEQLQDARNDLRRTVTKRQEATLILMGILN